MQYLLDTNVVSDFVREIPSVQRRMVAISRELFTVSTVTLKEIEIGLIRNPDKAKKVMAGIRAFLSSVRIVSYDAQDAYVTGQLRAQLSRAGTPIGPYDVMIAGTALARGLILVTANVKEFSRVPNLKLENWRLPPMEVREPVAEYGSYRGVARLFLAPRQVALAFGAT